MECTKSSMVTICSSFRNGWIMAIERICCRGFSFKRKRKKLIGFMRDIWAFAIDEDRREVAGRIEREFAG